MDILNTAVPVITLLIGTGIGWLLRRNETRQTRSLEAGDLLADLPRYAWDRTHDESWINLQTYLGRLRIRLLAAELPVSVVERVSMAAKDMWHSVELLPGADGVWICDPEKLEAMEHEADEVTRWLLAGLRERRALRKKNDKAAAVERADRASDSTSG